MWGNIIVQRDSYSNILAIQEFTEVYFINLFVYFHNLSTPCKHRYSARLNFKY